MTFVFLIPAVAGAICKFIVFPSTMATSGSISLLCLLVVLCFSCSPAMAQPLYQVCDDTGNYTANSTYKSNLDLLLSLASNGSLSGFYNGTAGRSPDQVSGIILCRGDVTTADCSSCLATAGQVLLQLCPNKRGATVWYDDCLVRYSNNQSFFSSTDNSPMAYLVNEKDIAEVSRFDKLVSELMSGIADQAAASNGSSKKFATGTMSNFTSEFPIVYGLVQCTPDLSRSRCRQCLQKLFDVIPNLFEGKQGARAVGVRCNMRYEVYSFYQSTPTLILTAPPASGGSGGSGKKKKNSTGTILAIAIPVATAVLLISIVCICYWRRKSAKKPSYETDPEKITSVESLLFDLSTLRIATCNFSDENKLGEGGFGAVYKGLLPDGREIAVKKLLASEQGLGELKNELVLVAKLQHRNLVRFLGVCFEEEKMLVYEYVPNGSLDKLMFDAEKRERLHWGTRYKIIDGIARGLLYLHEESQHKIIHRDLKASNVLLDSDMSPKITDFGLAKLFGGDQTQGTTSRIVGTFGYMAPEYAMHGHFSAKSDVFSFGVLVLEILTGRKNTGSYDSANSEDLLSYAWERWTAGRGFEILDPVLGIQFPSSDVLKCIKVGLLCVQENPVDRPKMSTVNVMLNSDSVSLPAPSRPAFCVGKSSMDPNSNKSILGTKNQTTQSVTMSPNEVSISELEPR
ncbi:cysteine-rich receptor-like protein kinase 44 [Musa acuminata AAA Group]|uniref:cysteine-rich receptor-like protein kinase 44 n=1 Tax=Musa acuminata AAA Group TaxID=214697 RepID=UPI0031D26DC1